MLQNDCTTNETQTLLQEFEENPSKYLGNLSKRGNRAGKQAEQTREKFAHFFDNIDPLPWQENYIKR